MHNALVDLEQLVQKLAKRTATRTEATIQGELHALLLAAPLNLDEGHVKDIVLEQPAGQRRRIDVEVGFCVFEVKRDLRTGNVRRDGAAQLAGYVHQRTSDTGQRYVGVLTDGNEWHLYRPDRDGLQLVSSLGLNPDRPNVEELCVWLEGVLATADQIVPTPTEIERLLGAETPGHKLDMAELRELLISNAEHPAVRTKRQLWSKLLTTALGTAFRDDELLFCQHTLLVISAEIIAHAVLDIDPNQVPPTALVSGQRFRAARVVGVVEADFFDWVVEVDGGERLVRGLVRRLARFAWAHVDHDILKVLYESVIPTTQRKQLGEYYTPDWLAERVIEEVVETPLTSRVLDPSCGSGTFVFHAVRRFLAAAAEAGMSNKEALTKVCEQVIGVDLHPVAATLARVTYLLAIGAERLRGERGPLSIPVFLGDSLQWGQEETLQTHGALVVYADDGLELFQSELRFPDSLLADAGRFDALVSELADLACNRPQGSTKPGLTHVHQRYGIAAVDRETVEQTFRTMCSLHDQGRDHIWGYYVRNVARPRWLARESNRVDVLVGNPPWLSFRFMTEEMQAEFKKLQKERKLWAGAKSATHTDLSTLFVVRCMERYLKLGGRFGFVVPLAILSRQQFKGFREGFWPRPTGFPVCAAFDPPWDVHAVKPAFFEVPCSVIFGSRVEHSAVRAMPDRRLAWRGRLPKTNATWALASKHLETNEEVTTTASTARPASAYARRFTQGATLVPRVLSLVERLEAGPLGGASGDVQVRSRRSAAEKEPWKSLVAIEGTVESQFVLPVHVGDTILPYRPLEPLRAVVPWNGKQLLKGSTPDLQTYTGLNAWWTRVDAAWMQNRSSEKMTLLQRWDYQKGLSKQFLSNGICAGARVVYSKSGMYLAAAAIYDPFAVIDHKLYWAAVAGAEEARYLCAILNSEVLTLAVRHMQSRGEHNPRDFDKYVWQIAIPEFDSNVEAHQRLASLGAQAEAQAHALALPKTRFEKQRKFLRDSLLATDVGQEIEVAVRSLLG